MVDSECEVVETSFPYGKCDCGRPAEPQSGGYCNRCRFDKRFRCAYCQETLRKDLGFEVHVYGKNEDYICKECAETAEATTKLDYDKRL